MLKPPPDELQDYSEKRAHLLSCLVGDETTLGRRGKQEHVQNIEARV